jgi:hypothetical protein
LRDLPEKSRTRKMMRALQREICGTEKKKSTTHPEKKKKARSVTTPKTRRGKDETILEDFKRTWVRPVQR